jgi:hypothetical protein
MFRDGLPAYVFNNYGVLAFGDQAAQISEGEFLALPDEGATLLV